MDARLEASLGAALKSRVVGARPLSGGDINDAYEVRLADGREVFVKSNVRAPNDMFVAEAQGLAWLGEARALRVPAVLAASGANPRRARSTSTTSSGAGWPRSTRTARPRSASTTTTTSGGCRRRTRSASPGPSSTGCDGSARS
jgi:hypothetical protein